MLPSLHQPVGIVILLWVLAFALACRVADPGADAAAPGGAAGLLLGGSRAALGRTAIETADRYLHRGLGHRDEAALHGTWFQRIGARLSPTEVTHREGVDRREIVPWLWFGQQLNPTNVEYLLMAAYWLRTSGQAPQARALLDEAQRRLPREPAIYFERARLGLASNDPATARRLLDAGLRVSGPNAPTPPTPEARRLRASLQLYRGFLYERDGDIAAAVRLYREIVAADPATHAGLASRIADLEAGRTPELSAANALRRLLQAEPAVCEHDAHDHAKHGHDADADHDREHDDL